MPNPETHFYNDPEELAEHASRKITSFIDQELSSKSVVRIALGGSKSHILIYKKLTDKKSIPWSRVVLFLTDEKYAPLNSRDSNYATIKEHLADSVSNLRRFYHYNTRDQIPTIVDQYEKTLRVQEGSPLFDLVILDIGADGRVASLFPYDSALHERNRLVTRTQNPDQNARDCMTLTFPAILDSKKIILLAQGMEKQKIIDALLNGNHSADQLPAKKLLEHENAEIFCSS